MPHVIVKLHRGRTPEQKKQLADAITQAVISSLNSTDDAISIAIEEVAPRDWAEKVYRPDILGRPDILFKKPGYELDT